MHYVYILRSLSHPKEIYIGHTHNLKTRLAQHNAGKSPHTSNFIPWAVVACVALPDKSRAERLERYLKAGSGRSFADRHLLDPRHHERNEGLHRIEHQEAGVG